MQAGTPQHKSVGQEVLANMDIYGTVTWAFLMERKTMRKYSCILTVAAAMIALGGAATQPAATPGTKPASQPGGDLDALAKINGISIRLPSNWDINAGGQALLEVRPKAADKDATGEFRASLVVAKGTFNKVPPDMATLGTALQSTMAKQETGYKVVDKPTGVTIGGLKGVKFGGTFKRGGAAVQDREYYLVVSGTQFYKLTFTSLASKWAGYQALAEKSIATFGLTK